MIFALAGMPHMDAASDVALMSRYNTLLAETRAEYDARVRAGYGCPGIVPPEQAAAARLRQELGLSGLGFMDMSSLNAQMAEAQKNLATTQKQVAVAQKTVAAKKPPAARPPPPPQETTIQNPFTSPGVLALGALATIALVWWWKGQQHGLPEFWCDGVATGARRTSDMRQGRTGLRRHLFWSWNQQVGGRPATRDVAPLPRENKIRHRVQWSLLLWGKRQLPGVAYKPSAARSVRQDGRSRAQVSFVFLAQRRTRQVLFRHPRIPMLGGWFVSHGSLFEQEVSGWCRGGRVLPRPHSRRCHSFG